MADSKGAVVAAAPYWLLFF